MHWLQIETVYNDLCGHILSFWVDDEWRKKGIGRELKRQGEEWAKQQNAKFMLTEVFYPNKNMIDYNLKLGYKAGRVEMIKDL